MASFLDHVTRTRRVIFVCGLCTLGFLGATRAEPGNNHRPGPLDGVSHILRVNTEGGLVPTEPGEFVGETARIPYTADYYFYRSHK